MKSLETYQNVAYFRRKIVSVFCGAGSYCYVTESGKVYFGGRHSMRVHPETGMILGLDGIHTVSVALGKTHAVAISKHGHVYTWGLNNLNQVFQYHNYLHVSLSKNIST